MKGTSFGPAFGRAGTLLLASLVFAHLTLPASTYYFESYVKWANAAFQGGPTDSNCTTSGIAWLDFVYALVQQKAPSVGTGQLSSACRTCSAAIDATLSLYPSSPPSSCSLLPSPSLANLTARSLRHFVCLGPPDGTAAGSCVVQVVNALTATKLLGRVRVQDPTLSFTGTLLLDLCTALVPPPPAPPSCCPRTWAFLMAALAHQSCLPALAHEYLSLAGRCEAVLGRTVPGFCDASWPTDLLPLLTPPASCAPSLVPGAASWANGSACSADQLNQRVAPGSSCDLWCGVVGDMNKINDGAIPSPDDGGGSGDDSSTSSTGNGGGNSGGGGGGEKLQTATIVVVCVFSVLIAMLLVALALFGWTVHKEKQALNRTKFDFDPDFIFPPPGFQTNLSPGTGIGTGIGAGKLQTISTDIGAGGATAAAAATMAAAAVVVSAGGGDVSTPRYAPGGRSAGGFGGGNNRTSPSGGVPTLTFSTAAAGPDPARSSSRQQSGQPVVTIASFNMDRTGSSSLGLATPNGAGGATAAAAGGGGSAIGRSSVNSRASSSRYESATSVIPRSVVTQASGNLGAAPSGVPSFVTAPSSEPIQGVPVAVAVAVGGGGGAGAGAPAAIISVGDRLMSHPVSLSGSDGTSVYHTAHSPLLTEAFMAGGMAANGATGEGSLGLGPGAAGARTPLLSPQL